MIDRRREVLPQQPSQFNFKDGQVQSKLGRSQRNVEKYEARKSKRLASRGSMSFSSGK